MAKKKTAKKAAPVCEPEPETEPETGTPPPASDSEACPACGLRMIPMNFITCPACDAPLEE